MNSKTSKARRSKLPAGAGARGPLRRAWAMYAAGRLREAGAAAGSLMAGESAAGALHLLGVIALAENAPERALPLLQDAAARQPESAAVHNDLGETQRALGRLQEAETSYRRALELEPRNALARNNLGLVLCARGDVASAVAELEHALKLDASFGEAAMNLGNLRRETGDTGGALDAYRQASRVPQTALAAHMSIGGLGLALGNALLAREAFAAILRKQPGHPRAELGAALAAELAGDTDGALQRLRSLVRREPAETGAWVALGRLAARARQHAEAAEAYARVLALEPGEPDALDGLVRALLHEERLDVAEQHLRHALERGENADLLALLGDVLAMRSQEEAAEQALRRALALVPDHADAQNRLGELRVHVGELDEAAALFRAALHTRADHSLAWENLAMLPRRLLKLDEDIAGLVASIEDGGPRSPSANAALHFAAARLLDAAERQQEAEQYLLEANRVMHRLTPFDEAAHDALVDALITEVDRPLVESLQAWGDSSEAPLFIIGMPRSGTTLVEQMLSRHPAVHAAGEVPFFSQLRIDLAGRRYPASLHELDAATMRDIAGRYLAALPLPAAGVLRITDKMPSNYMHVGLIAALFPRARFICLRRRREDVGLSIFQQNFTYAEGNAWTYSLQHIARLQLDCERLMTHWQGVAGDRILDLPYEELVAEPEAWLRRVLDHVGLPWNPDCLDFAGSRRRVLTASAAQVREPVNRRGVGRAVHYPRITAALRQAYAELEQARAAPAGSSR